LHGFGGWIFTHSAVENAVYCTIDFRATGICLLSRIGKKRWFSKQKICLAMNKLYVPIFIMLLLLLLPKSDLCRLFGTIGHWRRGGRIFLPKRRKKKIGCKTCDGLLLLSVYIYIQKKWATVLAVPVLELVQRPPPKALRNNLKRKRVLLLLPFSSRLRVPLVEKCCYKLQRSE